MGGLSARRGTARHVPYLDAPPRRRGSHDCSSDGATRDAYVSSNYAGFKPPRGAERGRRADVQAWLEPPVDRQALAKPPPVPKPTLLMSEVGATQPPHQLKGAVVGDVQPGETHRSANCRTIHDGSSGFRYHSRPNRPGPPISFGLPGAQAVVETRAAEPQRSRRRVLRNATTIDTDRQFTHTPWKRVMASSFPPPTPVAGEPKAGEETNRSGPRVLRSPRSGA